MYNQRDIVLVPVPFTDLSATKRRPVLILSSSVYNIKSSDVVVAAITSNLSTGNYGVIIDSSDLEQGKLPVKSLVRADKIYTLSQTIIIKSLGMVSLEMFSKVLNSLDNMLGR